MSEIVLPENEYVGDDGLRHCAVCTEAKEVMINPRYRQVIGMDRHPRHCKCEREKIVAEAAEREERRHRDEVRRLRSVCFTNRSMWDWTFENDNGKNPQMKYAHDYVDRWKDMYRENKGLLLWGGVGTGKSFFAGCIANALMEQEIPVRMTNFAEILNDLMGNVDGRGEYIHHLTNRYSLLIIDDLGMERGTEFGLEQVYNVIDSRLGARKPLIVTTNLSIDQIRNVTDLPHQRIYDRVCEVCVPIKIHGESMRAERAKRNMESFKQMMQ